MTTARLRDLALVAAAAGLTRAAWQWLRRPDGPVDPAPWERTNHAGAPVTLLEGVAFVAGSGAAALLAGPPAGVGAGRVAGTLVAAVAAGGVGAVDDLRQDADRKGLAGHLGALAHGQVSTGALKILVLSAGGIAATVLADLDRERPGSGHWSGPVCRAAGTIVGGAVVAGSANLANLLDLRPGRTVKAGLLATAPLLLTGPGSPPAAIAAGSAAALLPEDLAGLSMLGDTGANPLGAMLGLALVERTGTRGRLVALGVLTGLTLASERVSFTAVIEATPGLRELDRWGRR